MIVSDYSIPYLTLLLQFKDSLDTAANLDEQLMEKVRRLSTESPPPAGTASNGPLKPDDDLLESDNPLKESCPLNGHGLLEPTDPGPMNGLLKPNSLHVLNSDGP